MDPSATLRSTHRARPTSTVNVLTLAALFVPPAGAALGVWLLREHRRFAWMSAGLRAAPWQLAVIVLAGSIATAAGVADWRFHRAGHRVVSRRESRAELLALAGGGAPLFALMGAATVISQPETLLIPVMAALLFTAVAICYDEMLFHRRACGAYEAALHRTLIGGNAVAFFAWAHLIFVASPRP